MTWVSNNKHSYYNAIIIKLGLAGYFVYDTK